jgi:hypothetical protein
MKHALGGLGPLPLLPAAAAAVVLSLAAAAVAQQSAFRMPAAVSLGPSGGQVSWQLSGPIQHPFAVLAGFAGGPFDLFGERLLLGAAPAPVTLALGGAAAGGAQQSFAVPMLPGLLGTALYGQVVLFDAQAANGMFRAGGAASSLFHAGGALVGSAFDDPVGEGFTGGFRTDVAGHLRGGSVVSRTHQTIDPQGAPFAQGLQNPLHPQGARVQMVYRPVDLGATGAPELLTAVRWRPLGPVQPGSLQDFELRIGHTTVHPDYGVDPWSALPVAPHSGLASTFASNYLPGAPPVRGYRGAYVIDPTQLTASGHLPYPPIVPFAYDGTSSLLLEFLVADHPSNSNLTGAAVRLMVQSSPLPGARLWSSGTPFQPRPIADPRAEVVGVPDNAMYELELDFAQVLTVAQSPFYDSGLAHPDYDAPLLAASLPPGTALSLSFRGANDARGTGATAFGTTPDQADGYRFLQFRLEFRAHLLTRDVPIVDSLFVPAY